MMFFNVMFLHLMSVCDACCDVVIVHMVFAHVVSLYMIVVYLMFM